MSLAPLYELGKTLESAGVAPPIGYAVQEVTVLLDLSNPYPKRLEEAQRVSIPFLERNGVKPVLLVDRVDYVFPGLDDKKHQAWKDMMQKYIDETGDDIAQQALDVVAPLSEWVLEWRNSTSDGTWLKTAKWVDFLLDGERLCDRPQIKKWWSRHWLSLQDTTPGRCIITNQESNICRIFPFKVKGLAGTDGAGVKLVSFDKPAFQTQGWKGNQNAPIGLETAIHIINGMQWLVNNKSCRFKFGGGLTYLYWNDFGDGLDFDPNEDEVCDLTGDLTPRLETATLERDRVTPKDSNRYHILCVRGYGARVAFSSYGTREKDELIASIRKYQKIHLDATQGKKILALWKIVDSLFPPGNMDKAFAYREFLDNIFFGKPFSQSLLIRLLDRLAIAGEPSLNQKIALLLLTQNIDMEKYEIAQRYGAIAALMHEAECRARGDYDIDTSVKRSMATLSKSPNQVLPRLFNLLHIHENSGKCKTQVFKIYDLLNPLPPLAELQNLNFGVNEQAAFWLGYCEQRSKSIQSAIEYKNKQEKTENE